MYLLSMIKLQYKKKGQQSCTQNERTIAGRYDKKIMPGANMRPVLCSFGITPASVVPLPSLVVVLALLALLSIVLPFALSFMLVSFVCSLCWHLLCWCLSCRHLSCRCLLCGGAVCHAGACHALRWHSGVAFIMLVSVVAWVWVCRAGVAFVLFVFVVGCARLFALKKRNISIE